MLANLLQMFRKETRLADVARGLAARTRHAVWQRVAERVPAMGVNESRGYIRARAATVVCSEVDALLRRDVKLRPANRRQLIDLTCDELTRQILAHVAALRTAPARVAVALRRAA
jgi:hypothetical protein